MTLFKSKDGGYHLFVSDDPLPETRDQDKPDLTGVDPRVIERYNQIKRDHDKMMQRRKEKAEASYGTQSTPGCTRRRISKFFGRSG